MVVVVKGKCPALGQEGEKNLESREETLTLGTAVQLQEGFCNAHVQMREVCIRVIQKKKKSA